MRFGSRNSSTCGFIPARGQNRGPTVEDELEELGRAPGQTVEERSRIFENAAAAMDFYLEGLDSIISSMEELQHYAHEHELQGEDSARKWVEKFKAEKKRIENSMGSM